MIANYHTHTVLCNHAKGDIHEYVDTAIQNGIKILGFSDHVACDFSSYGYHSRFRMEVSEIPEYVSMVQAVRQEYAGQIQILLGYECEYYPLLFQNVLDRITEYECDYLILGQHFTFNEFDGVWSNAPTEDPAVLQQYVDQVIEAMGTGKFSYVGHPDLIHYTGGDRDLYRQEMTRLCRAAKAMNIPLEINCLGLSEGRHYPNKDFWRIAAEENCRVILGSDAHRPEAVGNPEITHRAMNYAAGFGIRPMETLELRPVK